ncbi:MAG: Ornithine carbamoyltransferase [Cyanobacteriota bacterium erpe_2018_sw_39hr_WHONDRS-SW48-000098_B_bin.30]|jgi:ornithine carbamoyltransferase|nr:ornithine carbamoyltransferase [Candidatus Obscuribacter sp.]MBP7577818.1 ornithine carbamoyltransferase [Candidatus Obscuribacter sp.]MDQ5963849.1 Ornithine carbamoyltransferase [Cyanobacteriota bacterium erpe_2018_sw_39hr_WHONDRS-SW48-000098_B_bin.30]
MSANIKTADNQTTKIKASGRPQRMAKPEGLSALAFILDEHTLRGKDIIGIEQLSASELTLILDVAAKLKTHKFDETQTLFGKGQTLVMLFEKPSLRTRVTFEAGMTQLGGHAINIETKLGERESVPDIGKNLERWVDGVMARTFEHETVVALAANANVPVINGLSNKEHPCQALADFQTIIEHKGGSIAKLKGLKLSYVGDSNNVSNSLLLTAATLGMDFTIGCPHKYEPQASIWMKALELAKVSGATLTLVNDPVEAVKGADAVYTDVWTSMGQEAEAKEREKIFAPYQLNAALMQHAKADAIVMHCLPAHRGMEITDEVIDSPASVVFDQAENRLHAQKAILSLVL